MIIGVDVGTTSTKAILFDTNERAVGTATQGYPLIQEKPGQAQQDPTAIWQAVVKVIQQVRQQAPMATVTAVSLSTAMHSLLLLDAQHRPLTALFTWADNQAAASVARLRQQKDAAELYQVSGTPLHPMTPLAKLCWLQATQPALLARTAYFADLKSYLVWRLTAHFALDVNLASATGLASYETGQWAPQLLKKLAARADQLPQIVPIDRKSVV